MPGHVCVTLSLFDPTVNHGDLQRGDFKNRDGAVLFDAAWLTERDLEGALLVHTRAIVAHPGAYSLPGWVSVQAALDFLKAGAKGERKGPLEAFLRAAGVVL